MYALAEEHCLGVERARLLAACDDTYRDVTGGDIRSYTRLGSPATRCGKLLIPGRLGDSVVSGWSRRR
jgi:hypothetical protein